MMRRLGTVTAFLLLTPAGLAAQRVDDTGLLAPAMAQARAAMAHAELALARTAGQRVVLAGRLAEVQAALRGHELARSGRLATAWADTPPPAWADQDPADSLYRAARQALNRNDYRHAGELFRQIRSRYPRSDYAPDSFYWEAYAEYRRGGGEGLSVARDLLREQARRYPDAVTRRDAASLEARIDGELARRGDEEAARRLAAEATAMATVPPGRPVPPVPPVEPVPPVPPMPPRQGIRQGRSACDDDAMQVAALNAVMQWDAARALPLLEKVLARRDAESLCLRRRAVFIVSQHEGRDAERILLQAARTDPDAEVRSQAVFWLSQVDSPEAVAALDSILFRSTDREVQEKAIFALSQHNRREAQAALRRYAERRDIDAELRAKAVFWMGQSDDQENITFLQGLYGRVTDTDTKERIIFALSQNDRTGSDWFAAIARNRNEPMDLRKKALFWMGQRDRTTGADLASVYDAFPDREMKEQLIFVLAQKGDRAAVDKLITIARSDQDTELRKKAIFWLTQTDDPRVADLLADILVKP